MRVWKVTGADQSTELILNRCWFGSQGEVGLLFMQALTDRRRTSPEKSERRRASAERADQVAVAVFLHGKLGTL